MQKFPSIFLLCVVGISVVPVLSSSSLANKKDDAAASRIDFFAIGDWGGQELFPFVTHGQLATAKGMGHVAETRNAQFVVALGDNFYHTGVKDAGSYRFDWTFEDVYSAKSLKDIPWYVIGGNHDHYGNVTAQIEHSKQQGRWKFPSLYHAHQFAPTDKSFVLEVILLDTVELCGLNEIMVESEEGYFDALPLQSKDAAKEQWDWLERKLKASTADYLLVGGHYPVYSVCSHGPTETLIEHLKPLLQQYKAHYLSGHDHCMVHFLEEGVHYVLTGMGDECCYKATNLNNHTIIPPGALKWFLAKENKDLYQAVGGFSSFQATADQLLIQYHDHGGNVVFAAESILPRRRHVKAIH